MKTKFKYILIVLILLAVAGGTYFYVKNKSNDNNDEPKLNDNVKFTKEYSDVPLDNVFVYRDAKSIIKIMRNGTGVVYLGFPECPWCQAYVKYLNETAKEVELIKYTIIIF